MLTDENFLQSELVRSVSSSEKLMKPSGGYHVDMQNNGMILSSPIIVCNWLNGHPYEYSHWKNGPLHSGKESGSRFWTGIGTRK
jgi:hypothetical protein